MYALFNPTEAKNNIFWQDECYGFWRTGYGWTILELATIFSVEEIGDWIPLGSFWVMLPQYNKGE